MKVDSAKGLHILKDLQPEDKSNESTMDEELCKQVQPLDKN
jgi:hypothetical protein